MGLTPEGMQPFELDGSFAVCNGEIYGYEKFKNELLRLGINSTVRRKLGADIDAACGQLRREFESSRGDMVENSK